MAETCHPEYRQVVETYMRHQGIAVDTVPAREGVIDLEALDEGLESDVAGLLVQHPNFFGHLEPVREAGETVHDAGGLFVVSVDPISLGLLEPPGSYGADVAVGEGQSLGNHLSFGGPYLGFLAVREELVRRIPGRIVGETVDAQGRRGYVLTLQTREQHIRRERATSNICTNQALNALAASAYLALMGKRACKRWPGSLFKRRITLPVALKRVPRCDGPGSSLISRSLSSKPICPRPSCNHALSKRVSSPGRLSRKLASRPKPPSSSARLRPGRSERSTVSSRQ